MCRHYLQAPGAECTLAVHALGRLLTRPDTLGTLKAFVAWAPGPLLGDRTRSSALLLPGESSEELSPGAVPGGIRASLDSWVWLCICGGL